MARVSAETKAARDAVLATGRSWGQLEANEQALFTSANAHTKALTKHIKTKKVKDPLHDQVRQALDMAKQQGGQVRIQDSSGRSYMVPASDLDEHLSKPGAGTGAVSITHLLDNYDVASRKPGAATGNVEVVEPSTSGSGPTIDPANLPGRTGGRRAPTDAPPEGAEGPSGRLGSTSPAVSRNAKRRTVRTNLRRASVLSGEGGVPQDSPFGYVPAGSEPVKNIESNPPPFQEMGEQQGAALYVTGQQGSAQSTEEQEKRVREANASYRDELTGAQVKDPVTNKILRRRGAESRAAASPAEREQVLQTAREELGQRFAENPSAAEQFMSFGDVQTALGKEVTSAQTALKRARAGVKETEFEDVSGGKSIPGDQTAEEMAAQRAEESSQAAREEAGAVSAEDAMESDIASSVERVGARTENPQSRVDYENEADLFDVGPGELPPDVRPSLEGRGAGSLFTPKSVETQAKSIRGGTSVLRGPGSGVDIGNPHLHALRALVTSVQEAKRYGSTGKSQVVPKPEEGEMTPEAKERLSKAGVQSVPYDVSHPERTREEVSVVPGRSKFKLAEGMSKVPVLSPGQQAGAGPETRDAVEHPLYADVRRLTTNKVHPDAEHPLHDLALMMGLKPQSGSLEHIQQAIDEHLKGGSTSSTVLGRKAPVEPAALDEHVKEVNAANRRAPVDTSNRDEVFSSLVQAVPDTAMSAPSVPESGITDVAGRPLPASDKPMPPRPDTGTAAAGKVDLGRVTPDMVDAERRRAADKALADKNAAAIAAAANRDFAPASDSQEGPESVVPDEIGPTASELPAATPKQVKRGSVAPAAPVPVLGEGDRVQTRKGKRTLTTGGSDTPEPRFVTGEVKPGESVGAGGTPSASEQSNAEVKEGLTRLTVSPESPLPVVGRSRGQRNRTYRVRGVRDAQGNVREIAGLPGQGGMGQPPEDAEEATDQARRELGGQVAPISGARADLTATPASQYSSVVPSRQRNRIERRRGQTRIATTSTGTEVHRTNAPRFRSQEEQTLAENSSDTVSSIASLDPGPESPRPRPQHEAEAENINPAGLLPHESVVTSPVTESEVKPATRVKTGGREVTGGRRVVAAQAKSPTPVLPGAAPTARSQVLNTSYNPQDHARAVVAGAMQEHLEVLNTAREAVGLPSRAAEQHHAQVPSSDVPALGEHLASQFGGEYQGPRTLRTSTGEASSALEGAVSSQRRR